VSRNVCVHDVAKETNPRIWVSRPGLVPHARKEARGPKQPKRGFRPRGARVARRGVRVAETSGSSSASPRARTSAIAAEPPLTAASAAAASGACSAISPEPQAGSESDRCRAGKPFFREGHRLAVGRARVSARGGVGDDASAPSKERERAEGAERPERRSDASLAKGDGPTRQPGRCRCAPRCATDASATRRGTRRTRDGPPAPAPPRRDARALCGGSSRTPAVACS
jgi:hypothetical protein